MSDKPLPGQLPLFSMTKLCNPNPERLARLVAEARLCQKCELRQGCRQVVVGEGQTQRPLVAFVGEAPGTVEDQQNRPFAGPALELLYRMVDAMKIVRTDVFFCNVVACRPDKRSPTAGEIANCREWFVGQLQWIQPQVIVALGSVATNALLETKKPEPIAKYRGAWHSWQGIPMRVSFHPKHLLRTPLDKPYAWQDMQEVVKQLQSANG